MLISVQVVYSQMGHSGKIKNNLWHSFDRSEVDYYNIVYFNVGGTHKRLMNIKSAVYIRLVNDTLFITQYYMSKYFREISSYEEKVFTSENKIALYKEFYENFDRFRESKCYHVGHTGNDDKRKNIRVSKNEWEILGHERQNMNYKYLHYKVFLLRFYCLPLRENLRQRKIAKEFFKEFGINYKYKIPK